MHILASVLPMLRGEGIPDEAIYKMLIENPRRVLTVDWDDELIESFEFDVRQRGLTYVPV